MNIPVIVYDENGLKDTYQVKSSKEVNQNKKYFRESRYEKPSEIFKGKFNANIGLSYGDPLDILISLE